MDSAEAGVMKNVSSILAPLELEEEELTSLVLETGGGGRPKGKFGFSGGALRKRAPGGFGNAPPENEESTGFRGLLRSKTLYHARNACLLACLAWLVLLFVDAMSKDVERIPVEENYPRKSPHESSFGGSNNFHHTDMFHYKPREKKDGKNANDDEEPFDLPWQHGTDLPEETNVGEKVNSLSPENILNSVGHYWHDPFRSPFASPTYNVSLDVLFQRQQAFELHLNLTKAKFGQWQLVDPYLETHDDERPRPDFSLYPNGDVPLEDFPADSWQLDQEYVGKFVDQAKYLVRRVKEGIYQEYGYGSFNADGTYKSDDELSARDEYFGVFVMEDDKDDPIRKGAVKLSKTAWEAWVTKLLHAMVTTGDLFVVLVGDGAAAGHGNNFMQSSIMQFHYVMEPVLDFLGIRLWSRNMAMKDTSVIHQAMGGADLLGETDLLWYSSDYPDDSDGALDLLYKQAILGGERVPLILTDRPGKLYHDSNGTAWLGKVIPNSEKKVCKERKDGVCNFEDTRTVCWVDLEHYVPTTEQDENIPPGDYPRFRAHQWKARQLSMLILQGVNAALDKWVAGIEEDGFPLKEPHWHVSGQYDTVREAVRLNLGDKAEEKDTACEAMMGELAVICHLELHAFTEWTPRVRPFFNSLRALITLGMDIGNYYVEPEYTGPDLLPLEWQIPNDEVDVHAIAVSTNAPCREEDTYNGLGIFLYDDDSWMYRDDDVTTGLQSGDRRVTSLRRHHHRFDRVMEQTQKLKVQPGSGWMLWNPVAGFCDGSSQSECGRDEKNTCLMTGHNDHRDVGLLGDDLSGWLVLELPAVKEGIVLARIETREGESQNTRTKGWTSVNNATKTRELERSVEETNNDFWWFDYAIDGEVESRGRDEFRQWGLQMDGDLRLVPLMWEFRDRGENGQDYEVAFRVRSNQKRTVSILLTHIYYA